MYKSTGIEKNVSQYQLPTRKIIFILFLTKLIKTYSQNLITPLLSLKFLHKTPRALLSIKTKLDISFIKVSYKVYFEFYEVHI